MSKEEEAAFLAPFFEAASKGGILTVRDIKQALDSHLGRTVPLSRSTICCTVTTGASLPRTSGTSRPMKADVEAQADWKNSRCYLPWQTNSGF